MDILAVDHLSHGHFCPAPFVSKTFDADLLVVEILSWTNYLSMNRFGASHLFSKWLGFHDHPFFFSVNPNRKKNQSEEIV
ncbi:hypothetical protein M514_04367 [Trichuris suis]|uniref:Uncharacterized protein n=1 Tax=Trichuris suis TaxID=68888 RepID=A0A085N4K5_9BILA|nr:hypothetical protein M513_04367 [Trichuris suis]KFD64401.1 hypothetical protein M514_04367 [Trichuris suis]